MSNDAHPIQSYGIDRDSYVIRYGATNSIKDAEITTTIGIIVDMDTSADLEEPEFSGKKYRYFILSHDKALAKPDFIGSETDENKTEEELTSSTPENSIKWEEIVNRSLLYVTESNELFQKYDRVFVEKNGSNLEIKGYPSYGRSAVFADGQFITGDGELCDIQIESVKELIDSEGNPVEGPPAPELSAGSSAGAIDNNAPREKKDYRYVYRITSKSNCSDKQIEEFQQALDSYITDSKQESESIEFFDGWEKKNGRNEKRKIPGRKYKGGGTYWNGTMKANFDIIIPIKMEKDLKALCKEYSETSAAKSGGAGQPLQINSVFRSQEKQRKLYELYQRKKKIADDDTLSIEEKKAKFFKEENLQYDTVNPASKPPSSPHNFGMAVDFQITGDKNDENWHKKPNGSFTRHHGVDLGDTPFNPYPKVYRWLKIRARKHNFIHPPGVNGTGKLFEGWHWVWTGGKP